VIEASLNRCRLQAQQNSLAEKSADATFQIARIQGNTQLLLQAAQGYIHFLPSLDTVSSVQAMEESIRIAVRICECIRDICLNGSRQEVHEGSRLLESKKDILRILMDIGQRLVRGMRGRSKLERAQDTALLQLRGFSRILGNDDRLEFVSVDARARALAGIENTLSNDLTGVVEDSPTAAGKLRIDAPPILNKVGREVLLIVADVQWQRLRRWYENEIRAETTNTNKIDKEILFSAYSDAKEIHLAAQNILSIIDVLINPKFLDLSQEEEIDLAYVIQLKPFSSCSNNKKALIKYAVPKYEGILIKKILLDRFTFVDPIIPKLLEWTQAVRSALYKNSDEQFLNMAEFLEPYLLELTSTVETVGADIETRPLLDDYLQLAQLLLVKASLQPIEDPAKAANQILLTALTKHVQTHRTALATNRELSKMQQQQKNSRRRQQNHDAKQIERAVESREVIDKYKQRNSSGGTGHRVDMQKLRRYAHVAEDVTTAFFRLHSMPSPRGTDPIPDIVVACSKIADFLRRLPQSSLASSRQAMCYILGLQSTVTLALLAALAPICVEKATLVDRARSLLIGSNAGAVKKTQQLLLVAADIDLYLKSPIVPETAWCLDKLERARLFIEETPIPKLATKKVEKTMQKLLTSLDQVMRTVYGILINESDVVSGIKLIAGQNDLDSCRRYAKRIYLTIAVNAHILRQAEVWSGHATHEGSRRRMPKGVKNEPPRLARLALMHANGLAKMNDSDLAPSAQTALHLLRRHVVEDETSIVLALHGVLSNLSSSLSDDDNADFVLNDNLVPETSSVPTSTEEVIPPEEEEEEEVAEMSETDLANAATRITSNLRGWLVRKQLHNTQRERSVSQEKEEQPTQVQDATPFDGAARLGAEARLEHQVELEEIWRGLISQLLKNIDNDVEKSKLQDCGDDILKTAVEYLGSLKELTTILNYLRPRLANGDDMLDDSVGVKLDRIERFYNSIYKAVVDTISPSRIAGRLPVWNAKETKDILKEAEEMSEETKTWITTRKNFYMTNVAKNTKPTTHGLPSSNSGPNGNKSNANDKPTNPFSILEDDEDDDNLDAILGPQPKPGPNAQTSTKTTKKRRNRRGAATREAAPGFGGRKRGGGKIYIDD